MKTRRPTTCLYITRLYNNVECLVAVNYNKMVFKRSNFRLFSWSVILLCLTGYIGYIIGNNNRQYETTYGGGRIVSEFTIPKSYTTSPRREDVTHTVLLTTNGTGPANVKYGKPVTGSNHLIVYNRVAKAGSRTLIGMLESIQKRNGFTEIFSTEEFRETKAKKYLPTYHRLIEERIKFVKLPAAVYGHFPYLKIKESNNPVYINMIREPLDQRVSQYYFVRFRSGYGDHSQYTANLRKGSDAQVFLNQTYNDCVLTSRDECLSEEKNSYQVAFFCGIDPKCRTLSEWSLEKAKKNVEENYLFVGIMEEFEASLLMMEKLAPTLFDGIANRYKDADRLINGSKTLRKTRPSPEVQAIMKEKLEIPYKFYSFVKSKFYKLREELDIQPQP